MSGKILELLKSISLRLQGILFEKYGLINLVLFLVFLRIILIPFMGSNVDSALKVGDIAPEDIRASRDIRYIDVEATDFKKRDILRTIPPVFSFQNSSKQKLKNRIDQFADYLGKPKVRKQKLQPAIEMVFHEFGFHPTRATFQLLGYRHKPSYWKRHLKRVGDRLSRLFWFNRSRDFFSKQQPYGIILSRDGVEERINPFTMDGTIFQPVNKKKIEKTLSSVLRVYHPVFRSALLEVILSLASPNIIYDKDRSKIYEKNALDKVAPVLLSLKKNEIVVRRGDRITVQQFEKIKALKIKRSRSLFSDATGFGVLLLAVVFLVIGYLVRFFPDLYLKDIRYRSVIIFFAFLNVIAGLLSRGLVTSSGGLPAGIFIPITISAITITMVLDERLSYFSTIVFAFFSVLVSGGNYISFIMIVGSGGIAARIAVGAKKRTDLWKAGVFVSIFLFIMLGAGALLETLSLTVWLKGAVIAFANGILSAIITVGLIPFFESFLRVPTRFKLLELADTNSPLLKRMQIEATGTYTHSIIVGNLAESAAANIEANALLARVGSYYHDIGKIDLASYFSENQQGIENKHKDLKPSVSRSILLSHVKQGMELARSEGLPGVVCDFIEQHHGKSIMKFFYHQALDNKDSGVSREDFRYPGPRPQTKETAIVMLADSVEAASKSLKDPTPQRIDNLVTEIIRNRFLDGELDESPLTLRDLRIITKSFVKILNSLFHARIEYPEEKNIKHAEAKQRNKTVKRGKNGN